MTVIDGKDILSASSIYDNSLTVIRQCHYNKRKNYVVVVVVYFVLSRCYT